MIPTPDYGPGHGGLPLDAKAEKLALYRYGLIASLVI
jgi:hypothetical protein